MPAQAAEPRLILSAESKYNSIFLYESGPHLQLTFGHNRRFFVESVANPSDPLDMPTPYARALTVLLAYVPRPRRALMIGMGGGTTSNYLERSIPELAVTDVELDPEVVRIAQRYFNVKSGPRRTVVTQDGRIFMQGNAQRFDLIMLDAYRSSGVPFHLLTKEFYQLVASRLTPEGAVAQNVAPTNMLFDSAVATVDAVFPNVDFYKAGENVIMVAYQGPPRDRATLIDRATQLDQKYRLRYPLGDIMKNQRRSRPAGLQGKVLTDDFAPVESLRAIERNNLDWKPQ